MLLAEIVRWKLRIAADFYDIGEALREIQNKKLYRALGHAKFADMLKARRVMGATQAYRLIQLVSSVPREKALAIGSEKAFRLIDYAKVTPEPDNASWLTEQGTLPGGKRVAEASTREIVAATKAVRAKGGAKKAKIAANEAARSVRAALRKRGASAAASETMPRGAQVRVLGAAFGCGAKLHVAQRIVAAAPFAFAQIRNSASGGLLSFRGVMLMAFLAAGFHLTDGAIGLRGGRGFIALPVAGGLAFLFWIVVGLFRWESKPPTGHIDVRDDAVSCRFADGSLVDLPWSEVVQIRADAAGEVLFVEHGPQEITELHGTRAELTILEAEMGAALERFLPVHTARRVLGRDGKRISDWLASVRATFQPGVYRTAPPPLTRDQLVRVLLCPRLGADERIAAAAAISMLGGEGRDVLSLTRIMKGRVESPALRIAAERAVEDALDEAALAEAVAQAPGKSRLHRG